MIDLEPLRTLQGEMPPSTTEIAQWRGGPCDDGSFQSPYPEYGPIVDRMWAAFTAAGFPDMGQREYTLVMERWCAEHGVEQIAPEHVALMDRELCYNLLRQIQRSERFCDGAWLGAWRDGLFHALVERLLALGDA